jgi:arginine repressor
MRRSLLILAMLTSSILVFPQVNLDWAKGIGGANTDDGNSISIDDSGNVIVVGFFRGTVDFDPGPGVKNLTSFGGSLNADIFILKLDNKGSLVWVRSMGGKDTDLAKSCIVDDKGNIYTVGYFSDTVDFDPNAGNVIIPAIGDADMFIQKLDANGNLVWVKTIGGNGGRLIGIGGRVLAKDIQRDIAGNIYVTGDFNDTVDFDPGSNKQNVIAKGEKDGFILKLDATGDFVWVKTFGGSKYAFGQFVSIENSGNIYVSGRFFETVDFDPNAGIVNKTSSGKADWFILKLNNSGGFVWVKTMGGITEDEVGSITLDEYGNIYSTGLFYQTVDFDPGPDIFNLTEVGGGDVFIQKLDTAGNFVWAKGIGGKSFDFAGSIVTDGLGNVYTVGQFTDQVDFDPNSGSVLIKAKGLTNTFIQKLDSSGNLLWVKTMGGDPTASIVGKSHVMDGKGSIFLTGFFVDKINFDPNNGTAELTSNGLGDIFVQKLIEGKPVGIEFPHPSKINLYPNPTTGLFNVELPEGVQNAQYQVFDMKGKTVYRGELYQSLNVINLSGLSNGMYHISMIANTGEKFYGKVMVNR